MSGAARSHAWPRIAILGAGAGGMCAAMQLRRAGCDTYFLLEKGDTFGGTWRDNVYPGAACDVPSVLYSFSFEPKSDWSRKFAPQPEILAYFRDCAERNELPARTTFGAEVVALAWDELAALWHVRCADGRVFDAEVVIAAFGQLHHPRVPDLPGLDGFAGETMHSARYRRDVSVEGRDVVVVGNAASAVQLVPELAKQARSVRVVQRTPNWVGLRGDRAYTRLEHALFRSFPALLRLARWWVWKSFELRFPFLRKDCWWRRPFEALVRWEMRRRIVDPALRPLLVPTYPLGCNRFLISDDYLEVFARPNVELLTSGIAAIDAHAVVTRDGARHPADVLVFATGFETSDFLARLDVRGREGRSLADAYREGAHAYLGMTVPGFPNLFQLYGPNTNLGHNSILFMIEAQVGYVLGALDALRGGGHRRLEVRADAMARFDAELQRELAELVFTGDCHSWYRQDGGRVVNNWAYDTAEYARRTARFDVDAYELG